MRIVTTCFLTRFRLWKKVRILNRNSKLTYDTKPRFAKKKADQSANLDEEMRNIGNHELTRALNITELLISFCLLRIEWI